MISLLYFLKGVIILLEVPDGNNPQHVSIDIAEAPAYPQGRRPGRGDDVVRRRQQLEPRAAPRPGQGEQQGEAGVRGAPALRQEALPHRLFLLPG